MFALMTPTEHTQEYEWKSRQFIPMYHVTGIDVDDGIVVDDWHVRSSADVRVAIHYDVPESVG